MERLRDDKKETELVEKIEDFLEVYKRRLEVEDVFFRVKNSVEGEEKVDRTSFKNILHSGGELLKIASEYKHKKEQLFFDIFMRVGIGAMAGGNDGKKEGE